MAYTQVVLGAYSLPALSDYEETREFRGAMVEMADGTVQFDVVTTSAKRLFVLYWTLLTDAQKATLESAYDALKTATATLVLPTGVTPSPTVSRTKKELVFKPVMSGGNFLWSTSMELREV